MTEDQIRQALRDCYDPEVPCNIVDLGLVYSISIAPDPDAPGAGIAGVPPRHRVDIGLTLTSKGCPAHTQIVAQIEGRLSAFETISRTSVDLVWQPAWTPARISPEGRKLLGIDSETRLVSRRKRTPEPLHPFDLAHGVETGGLVPAGDLVTGHPSDEHVTAYYGVAPSILRSLVALWLETGPTHPIGRYTFVDIGAGKGRAILVASELPFRQVIGVELNPAMADIAQRNVDNWLASHSADPTAPPHAPVRLVEQDVLDFDFPKSPCIAFLFHPFEAPLMKKFLRRLERQFANRPSDLDILYVNAECAQVFAANPGFKQLWLGKVPMSPEDHIADIAAIAQQRDYGSTGDEECAIYRYTGRSLSTAR